MLKVAFALSFAIFFGALGDILMSNGMRQNGAIAIRRFSDIPQLLRMVFTNAHVLAGVVSMAIYFGSYVAALAWVDVSVANPLTALSYVIATAYAYVVLRERMQWSRVLGVALVTVGAVFIGLSS